MFAPLGLDQDGQWCPICGRDVHANDDAGIARHPMRYAEIVAHLAEVVTGVERTQCRWEPIWTRPMVPA